MRALALLLLAACGSAAPVAEPEPAPEPIVQMVAPEAGVDSAPAVVQDSGHDTATPVDSSVLPVADSAPVIDSAPVAQDSATADAGQQDSTPAAPSCSTESVGLLFCGPVEPGQGQEVLRCDGAHWVVYQICPVTNQTCVVDNDAGPLDMYGQPWRCQ